MTDPINGELCVYPLEAKCHPTITADLRGIYKGASPTPAILEVVGINAQIHPNAYNFDITSGGRLEGGGYLIPGYVPKVIKYRLSVNGGGSAHPPPALTEGHLVMRRGFKAAHVNYFAGGSVDPDDPDLASFTVEFGSPMKLSDDGDGKFQLLYPCTPYDFTVVEDLRCKDRHNFGYGVGVDGVLTTDTGLRYAGQLIVDTTGDQYPTVPFDHVVHSETREPTTLVDSVRGGHAIEYVKLPMPVNESTDTFSSQAYILVEGYQVNGDFNTQDYRYLKVGSGIGQAQSDPYEAGFSRVNGMVQISLTPASLGASQSGAEQGAYNATEADSSKGSAAIGVACVLYDTNGQPTGASFTKATFYSQRVGTLGKTPDPPLDVFGVDWGDEGGQRVAAGGEVLTFEGAALPAAVAGQLLPNTVLAEHEAGQQPVLQHVYQEPGVYQVFGLVKERGDATAQAAIVGPVVVTIQPCLEIGDAPPFISINNLRPVPRGSAVAFE